MILDELETLSGVIVADRDGTPFLILDSELVLARHPNLIKQWPYEWGYAKDWAVSCEEGSNQTIKQEVNET